MSNSDVQIVSYLLKETEADRSAVIWTESAPEAYAATLRGIELELFAVEQSHGRCLQLTLWCSSGKIDIGDLLNHADGNESAHEQELARQLRNLARAAAGQCAARVKPAQAPALHEWFYRRLVGVESGSPVEPLCLQEV